MTEVQGPYGRATRIDIRDRPDAAQTVDHWLIDAPGYHPLWSQYVLCCVRLDDVEGFPPPHRQFDGATHEVLVVTLNPEHGPHTPQSLLAAGGLRYLTPVNVAHQYIANDGEMREVIELAAYAVVNGVLNPETADAPTRIREEWLTSLTKTLAHVRGEEHAP